MTADKLCIRESRDSDITAIKAMYPDAFPDEDLVPLVGELLQGEANVLSLVATIDERIVGHVAFTSCGVSDSDVHTALLAPLAVAPGGQGRGIGTELVRSGLTRLEDADVNLVLVLGDPAYYGRFGFHAEDSVQPPYPLPDEWHAAWQSICLGHAAKPGGGELSVPSPWRKPALWAP